MIGDLFGGPPLVPGLSYQPAVLTAEEEAALLDRIRTLPFAAFDFHGFKGNRRVVSFGSCRRRARAEIRTGPF